MLQRAVTFNLAQPHGEIVAEEEQTGRMQASLQDRGSRRGPEFQAGQIPENLRCGCHGPDDQNEYYCKCGNRQPGLEIKEIRDITRVWLQDMQYKIMILEDRNKRLVEELDRLSQQYGIQKRKTHDHQDDKKKKIVEQKAKQLENLYKERRENSITDEKKMSEMSKENQIRYKLIDATIRKEILEIKLEIAHLEDKDESLIKELEDELEDVDSEIKLYRLKLEVPDGIQGRAAQAGDLEQQLDYIPNIDNLEKQLPDIRNMINKNIENKEVLENLQSELNFWHGNLDDELERGNLKGIEKIENKIKKTKILIEIFTIDAWLAQMKGLDASVVSGINNTIEQTRRTLVAQERELKRALDTLPAM